MRLTSTSLHLKHFFYMPIPPPVLRPATPKDADFQFRLFVSAHCDELTIPGWAPAQQEAFLKMQFRLRADGYGRQYPTAVTSIGLLHGVPVGELIVQREPASIHVVDVSVLPVYEAGGLSHSSAGLGRWLLSGLIEEARQSGRPLLAQVLNTNRAKKLWLRMGFIVTGDDGVHAAIEWRPSPAPPTPRG